jgi:Methyltransferase domain
VDPAEARRIARRAHRIPGWFSTGAAALFAMLDAVQHREQVTGGLFEIGVHHGRSAVLLCLMARPGESVGACDVFEHQALNVSESGAGDRARFERNVADFAPGFDRLVVYEKSSADLRADEITGPQRLFHVDGGHAYEEALGDIRLGAQVVHERGAIVVDDPFRPEWPGVTEAILRFLDERTDFSAVIVGFNKLVLVRDEARRPYERALEAPWEYFDRRVYLSKSSQIGGRPTTVFYVPTFRQFGWIEPLVARALSLEGSVRHRLKGVTILGRDR